MRALPVGIFFLGLMVLPVKAQTGKGGEQDTSRYELEHQQLRDLLASQSVELQATREQLRQLQQRMELLEIELRTQGVPPATKEIAGAPNAPEIRNPDPNVASVALPSDRRILQGGNRADTSSTNQEDKSDSIQLANGKVRIGTLLYADYAYYTKTGFGPQFTSQVNPPGPANNGYNTFEITRAYINLFYSPGDAITFRLTPDLYRQIGAAPATKVGKVSAIGPNTDQGLPFRLKYAYVDFNTLFASSNAFKKDKLTIGQQQDPVIEWEERLYGYRYANIVPWDYLGYSSSWAGIALHGPIEFNNKMYLDYSIGVYNNSSYRLLEQSEKKQAAARLTVYPLGARSNYDGIGFTGFYDFGYTNVTPDSGVNIPLYRVSALAHYTFKKNAYAIAGEFEAGRNAFASGNFFSGSAPQDEFGLATTQYAGFDALVKALQNTNGAKQRGYAAFGHAQLPRSPFTLFAMYHSFSPNTEVPKNPIDFERIVAGISYKVNDRLSFALSSQNLIFRHSQFTFPATELQLFSPSLAAANPNGIANAVPHRVQAILANVGLNF
jgi:hypothetical protein